MRTFILGTIAALGTALAMSSPVFASFTECTVIKNAVMVNLPQGITMGRWEQIKQGEKVAVRDTYQDWSFVSHYALGDKEQYGWVQRAILTGCRKQEGTP